MHTHVMEAYKDTYNCSESTGTRKELGTTVERLGRLVLSQDASDGSIACCSQECGNGNSVASKYGLNT